MGRQWLHPRGISQPYALAEIRVFAKDRAEAVLHSAVCLANHRRRGQTERLEATAVPSSCAQ